jgi:hypothetical protein
MSDRRIASITAEDIQAIEDAGYTLYRVKEDTQALGLHALALRLRATSGLWETREFHCNVDESAGMAEIVDLHDFSKKVS